MFRKTDTETDGQTDRQTDRRQTNRDRQRDRDRQTETDKGRQRDTDRKLIKPTWLRIKIDSYAASGSAPANVNAYGSEK